MIDEVAEVKRYMDGIGLQDKDNYYRAVYMMAKYYRDIGFDREKTFLKIAEWVRKYNLTLPFSLITAVVAGYTNEKKLRCCATVKVSDDDIHRIMLFAKNKTDKLVALAVLCCAKALADNKGTVTLSVSALASWLNMDRANLHNRQLKRLEDAGYIKRLSPASSLRGWKKNDARNTTRLKVTVPYDENGEHELRDNDILSLYGECFGEKPANP